MSLDGIKARLGSLSQTQYDRMSHATRRLIQEDMPKLIAIAEAVTDFIEDVDNDIEGMGEIIATLQALEFKQINPEELSDDAS